MAIGDVIRGAASVLPEIPKPTRKPSITEKFIWTAIALVLFLVMSEVPLYGVSTAGSQANSASLLRTIFASSQGSLMELGIGPIVTAGLISQLLVGSELIKLDFGKPEDRSTFTAFNKVFTVGFIVAEAVLYTLSGYLRGPSGAVLSTETAIIVMLELIAASMVVFMLDQMIQRGWGFGSGISLFIMAGVALRFMLDLFSPISVGGVGYVGFIPATVNATLTGTLPTIVYRGIEPALIGFIATIAMMLFIIYLEGVRIEVPISSQKYKGFTGVYPIKLLYVSNIPVILVGALIANLQFFSLLLVSRLGTGTGNWLVNLLATYTSSGASGGQPVLTGGLLYYLVVPTSLGQAATEPLQTLTSVAFMIFMSVIFARLWVELGGMSPEKAAKSLLDAQVVVPGFRSTTNSLGMVLAKYIPSVTIIGGILVGVIASVSSVLGVFGGSGIGLLLMIDIILQYYQTFVKEQVDELMPRLGGLIGRS
ncbi:MAG: preprotein translocase subunit SecY [Nitrososphaerota archaeon]|nr:preprotein translocase subunit SecY [Nitrososphaerota archaeon]